VPPASARISQCTATMLILATAARVLCGAMGLVSPRTRRASQAFCSLTNCRHVTGQPTCFAWPSRPVSALPQNRRVQALPQNHRALPQYHPLPVPLHHQAPVHPFPVRHRAPPRQAHHRPFLVTAQPSLGRRGRDATARTSPYTATMLMWPTAARLPCGAMGLANPRTSSARQACDFLTLSRPVTGRGTCSADASPPWPCM
jgi:hypothetical protein